MRQTFFAENNLGSAVDTMAQVLEYLRGQGLTPRSLFIAELALEEMLTNTIKYAYDDDGLHRIELVVEVANGEVRLEIGDDGHYFDPTQAPAPRPGVPLATRAKGGCGIHLVRNLVDRFDYRREGERNLLQLGFPAAAPEQVAAG